MKTKLFLVSIIFALALVVVYLILINKSVEEKEMIQESQQANETTVANSESKDFSGVGTLASLQNKNIDLECSLTYKPNEYESEVTGTYFLSDGKVRGDFVVDAPELGGDIVTSIINDSETMYVWSDIQGKLFGTKTNVTTSSEAAIKVPVPNDVSVRYSCKPWLQVDGSVFVPPTTILFQEASKAGMEYGTVYEEGEF